MNLCSDVLDAGLQPLNKAKVVNGFCSSSFFACFLFIGSPALTCLLEAGRGVMLGDSWIAPINFVEAWGPYLQAFSLLDDSSLGRLGALANKTQVHLSSLSPPPHFPRFLKHTHACINACPGGQSQPCSSLLMGAATDLRASIRFLPSSPSPAHQTCSCLPQRCQKGWRKPLHRSALV